LIARWESTVLRRLRPHSVGAARGRLSVVRLDSDASCGSADVFGTRSSKRSPARGGSRTGVVHRILQLPTARRKEDGMGRSAANLSATRVARHNRAVARSGRGTAGPSCPDRLRSREGIHA
jgi:hypothetical protein